MPSSPTTPASPQQQLSRQPTMSQRIINLMDDPTNEVPYHIRLRDQTFALEDLCSVIRFKAKQFIKSLPEDMEGLSTPNRKVTRDKEAKWTDISAQPGMLETLGMTMLKILVVDVWSDFVAINS